MSRKHSTTQSRKTVPWALTSDKLFRNSHDPRATGHGGWFDFVRDMGDAVPELPFATHGRLLKQVERQRGMPAAALSAVLEVLAGRQPREGAEDLALNDYMIQDTNGLRLVRADTSGELAPLVQELIEWRLAETPITRELAESATTFVGKPETLELWKRYFVPDIASFFGEVYQQNVWRTGIKTLPRKKIMILLANVATQDLNYQNELLGPSLLKWFSQNQTRQAGLHGRIISGEEGHEVHLFVRRGNIINGRVNPFIYFGQPKFAGWTGETPIEVLWDLPAPVPQEFWAELGVPEVI